MADQQIPTTASRQAILDRLRTRPLASPAAIQVDDARLTTFDDPLTRFVEVLATVGGESHVVENASDVAERLHQIAAFRDARRVASVVPEIVQGNVDLRMVDDPHALATLDWTVARGAFAVAENGAIWVDGASLPHRAALFITQFLAIVVSRQEIVSNMHQAYRRLGQPHPRFGVFISGPSKTADIEQSLVLGAHGCRKMQVFLLP